ncbi:hypothetical protein HY988_03270 [Candidatus Micrarchaeota archaeon]|nr:hypothetical protein [Candidatus Micrarchaeota archaeon]
MGRIRLAGLGLVLVGACAAPPVRQTTVNPVRVAVPLSEYHSNAAKPASVFVISVADALQLQLFNEKKYYDLIELYENKIRNLEGASIETRAIYDFRLAIAYLGKGDLGKAFELIGPLVPSDDGRLASIYFLIRYNIKSEFFRRSSISGSWDKTLMLYIFDFRLEMRDELRERNAAASTMIDLKRFLETGASRTDSEQYDSSYEKDPEVLFALRALEKISPPIHVITVRID